MDVCSHVVANGMPVEDVPPYQARLGEIGKITKRRPGFAEVTFRDGWALTYSIHDLKPLITVGQLIQALKGIPEDYPVVANGKAVIRIGLNFNETFFVDSD